MGWREGWRTGPESESKARLEPNLKTGPSTITCGIKNVIEIGIESDTEAAMDIDRYKRKKNYIHAGAAAGIYYKGKSLMRNAFTLAIGLWSVI
ncbi:hypothetical protein EVAR_56831_1 [Eumeta japonica]|uniref:Uncharacterized protein n=1 Tax=Eumeta variegata TaxID=151549 RepID=A0A4C1ZCH4_EUMVA|nr:hypothetical protein EVAR_56831_1 [Eumeta japonica]